MPTTAKMMWKPSDTAICERAAKRSDTRDPGERRLVKYSQFTGALPYATGTTSSSAITKIRSPDSGARARTP